MKTTGKQDRPSWRGATVWVLFLLWTAPVTWVVSTGVPLWVCLPHHSAPGADDGSGFLVLYTCFIIGGTAVIAIPLAIFTSYVHERLPRPLQVMGYGPLAAIAIYLLAVYLRFRMG